MKFNLKPLSNFTFSLLCMAGIATFSQHTNAQQLDYPPHEKWEPDTLGNHRAVIKVDGRKDLAKAHILWRRRDHHPDKKMILIDASTGQQVTNVYYPEVSREFVDLVFAHQKGHDTYYLYYMPYQKHGRVYYPQDYYPDFVATADADWLKDAKTAKRFAKAELVKLESVTRFDSFYPMEFIATQAETKALLAEHSQKTYLVFPEDRLHPIKMKEDLPVRWIENGVQATFEGTAKKGENYAFQLGVYAARQDLQNLKVNFSTLKDNAGHQIAADKITCLNTTGVNYAGKPQTYRVDVPQGKIQALWNYIEVPENAVAGTYRGTVTITADNAPTQEIELTITISKEQAVNNGVDKPWNMTRLPWLNSTLAQKNTVVAPYTALKVDDNSVSLLGRKLTLSNTGLPAQIQTFFPIEMTNISDKPVDILAKPMQFKVTTADGKQLKFKSEGVNFTTQKPGTVEWTTTLKASSLEILLTGHIEFDGFVHYELQVKALQDIALRDINLTMPLHQAISKYFMGLGHKGGLRPEKIDWTWDVATKNQDGGWIGTVNAGLKFSLRDNHYERPLNTNFYLQKPLISPVSWDNNGRGGIQIDDHQNTTLVKAYSGKRQMQKGEILFYNFNLLITPFHAINTDWHWAHKYFHDYKPIDTVKAFGANVINIHQGKYTNPYINYPFIATKAMKTYIDSAHQAGMKVKIYNTIRELANRAYELYPLRSLNHEIFPEGEGGGSPWLQEHLDGNYIAGWYTPETDDAAIVSGGMSRWQNYYIEGLRWLVQNIGIDGLYLDDVAFNRTTMKRLKRELLLDRHPGIVDLHSANQHNERDGWNNSALLYMPLFPYINRLWFGEIFDYENNSPAFYMTEMSGLPFGLMGEMLEDGGNPWRGMLYGMTNRGPWTGSDPRPVWKIWKLFGMKGSDMIGYWVPNSPVKTDNDKVLVTVYKKEGKALLSIASWAKEPVEVHLDIDWKALGINPKTAKLTAPASEGFQPAAEFNPSEGIPVTPNKGWLLILE